MPSQPGVVVTLDGQQHDPSDPVLRPDDPAVLRGDGVFETVLVRDRRPRLLAAHLTRLSRSAQLTGLPAPDLARWRTAVDSALARWSDDEGVLRLIYSRGRTALATLSAVPEHVAAARRDGVAALTLGRGLPAVGADAMPWHLAGVKTLSYALNVAALRHAERHGADDVVFVSSDGFILEGPRSTVVIAAEADGKTVLLTPPRWYPILPGTTQDALFATARACGYDCREQPLRPTDLVAAHGIWLMSSITLAARVHTLDGRRLPPAPIAAALCDLVDEAIS
jgi:4-amino-4-deoxychorismate lyase